MAGAMDRDVHAESNPKPLLDVLFQLIPFLMLVMNLIAIEGPIGF